MYVHIYIYDMTRAGGLKQHMVYTTATTQRGRCIEAFVSILAQLQSQKWCPGGGGV